MGNVCALRDTKMRPTSINAWMVGSMSTGGLVTMTSAPVAAWEKPWVELITRMRVLLEDLRWHGVHKPVKNEYGSYFQGVKISCDAFEGECISAETMTLAENILLVSGMEAFRGIIQEFWENDRVETALQLQKQIPSWAGLTRAYFGTDWRQLNASEKTVIFRDLRGQCVILRQELETVGEKLANCRPLQYYLGFEFTEKMHSEPQKLAKQHIHTLLVYKDKLGRELVEDYANNKVAHFEFKGVVCPREADLRVLLRRMETIQASR